MAAFRRCLPFVRHGTRPILSSYHNKWHLGSSQCVDSLIKWSSSSTPGSEKGNETAASTPNASQPGDVYSPAPADEYFFDTHSLVLRLQRNGFTSSQSETIVASLADINSSTVSTATKFFVTKSDLAQLELKVSASLEAVRKDMVILEKSEFTLLKGENEKIKAEVLQLRKLLNDELLKLKSSVTLDMTLDKGKSSEDISSLKQLIKDTNNRIETEVAKLRTDMEAQKLDLIKYLVGSVLSLVTVSVGVWRFLKL